MPGSTPPTSAGRLACGPVSTPAATLSFPPDAGRPSGPVSPVFVDLDAHGYVETELFASGTARAYRARAALGPDGCWDVAPAEAADYCTRVVVRRPAEASRSSGVILVEWCNVSGGIEAAPDWAYLHAEILRAGHVYVAVSAQALGVHGGPGLLDVPAGRGRIPAGGLAGTRPERYGRLRHPGDRFALDIYAQLGAALRGGGQLIGGLPARRVVAVGESQSAVFLTTFVDAVHPATGVYDGFLIHSRGGSGASIEGTVTLEDRVPVRIRDDLDVPVLQLETETDLGPLLQFSPARQPDTGRLRTWEVAGTAHADAYLVGQFASAFGWEEPINDGPHHWVAQGALAALVRWVDGGAEPAPSAPLELASSSPPVLARDELGNAVGGVRTPDVDVPVAALSGEAPPGADEMRALFGTTTPFDRATLRRLYGDRSGYLARYESRLDEVIGTGFLLGADRAELMARAERVDF